MYNHTHFHAYVIIYQLDHYSYGYAYTYVYSAFILLHMPTLSPSIHMFTQVLVYTYNTTHAGTYTHSHMNTHTPYIQLLPHILRHPDTHKLTQSHAHNAWLYTQTLSHMHVLCYCVGPSPSHGQLAPAADFPSRFSLFFLATMSIFGKGSIFTLSGNIFPLGCELVRPVRRDLVAMLWARRAEITLGGKPKSGRLPGVVWQPQQALLLCMTSQMSSQKQL